MYYGKRCLQTSRNSFLVIQLRDDLSRTSGAEFARRLFQKWLSCKVFTSNTPLEGHLLINMHIYNCDMYIGTALYILRPRYVHVLYCDRDMYIGTALYILRLGDMYIGTVLYIILRLRYVYRHRTLYNCDCDMYNYRHRTLYIWRLRYINYRHRTLHAPYRTSLRRRGLRMRMPCTAPPNVVLILKKHSTPLSTLYYLSICSSLASIVNAGAFFITGIQTRETSLGLTVIYHKVFLCVVE